MASGATSRHALNRPFLKRAGGLVPGAGILTLQPFDTSTREGRSRERYRRALLTSLTSLVSRGLTILTALISVPLTVNYLGSERYGMWLTISSAFAFATVADLGIGAGLLGALSAADGKDDRAQAQRCLSSAFLILVGSAVIFGSLFSVAFPRVDWARFFNVSSPLAVREAGLAVAALAACCTIDLVLDVVRRTNVGYQAEFMNEVWQSFGSVVGLVGLLLAIHHRAGLHVLILAKDGAPIIATLFNGIVLFGWQRRWLRPVPRMADAATVRRLMASGFWFMAIAVSCQIITYSAPLVIAHTLGARDVPQYAVPARVFMALNVFAALLVNPLWPAYAEAMARGEMDWASRAWFRSVKVSLIAAVPPCLLLFLSGGMLFRWWVGVSIPVTTPLLGGLAVWGILIGVGNATTSLLLGVGAVRFHAVLRISQAIVAVLLQIVSVRWLGVPGIGWAMAIAELVCRFLPSTLFIIHFFRRIEGRTTHFQATYGAAAIDALSSRPNATKGS